METLPVNALQEASFEDPKTVAWLKETALKIKNDVEKASGEKFPMFEPVRLIEKDDRMIVRVHVSNCRKCINIDVSLKGQQLASYELNKITNDPLKFD